MLPEECYFGSSPYNITYTLLKCNSATAMNGSKWNQLLQCILAVRITYTALFIAGLLAKERTTSLLHSMNPPVPRACPPSPVLK